MRQQVDELAAEHERVRGSMRVSDTRTRAMEVVVSKMRTIGRAAYPLRHELSVSASPGHRLQAIASLQVMPDYDLLDWLANRIDQERPFVGSITPLSHSTLPQPTSVLQLISIALRMPWQ